MLQLPQSGARFGRRDSDRSCHTGVVITAGSLILTSEPREQRKQHRFFFVHAVQLRFGTRASRLEELRQRVLGNPEQAEDDCHGHESHSFQIGCLASFRTRSQERAAHGKVPALPAVETRRADELLVWSWTMVAGRAQRVFSSRAKIAVEADSVTSLRPIRALWAEIACGAFLSGRRVDAYVPGGACRNCILLAWIG